MRHDSLRRQHKETRALRNLARHCLNAVVPIFRDKFFNPVALIMMEYNIFGTLNKEPVDVTDFMVLQSASSVRKLSELKIGISSRHCNVRHDPYCKIGRQRRDLIQDARVARSLDGDWIIAREERTLLVVVVKYFPL